MYQRVHLNPLHTVTHYNGILVLMTGCFFGRLTVVLLEPIAVLRHHGLVLEKPSFTVITPICCRVAVENGKRRPLKTPPQPTLKYESCAIMQLLGICWCRLIARVDFPPLVILKDRT